MINGSGEPPLIKHMTPSAIFPYSRHLRMTHLFRAERASAVEKFCTYNWKSNNKAYLRNILETSIEFILKLTVEEAATISLPQIHVIITLMPNGLLFEEL